MRFRGSALASIGIVVVMIASSGVHAEETFYAGGDISMLPEIEKAGGTYREGDKPADAIAIMRAHGCNLFRVRLFVNPDPDFKKTDGATQDLAYVRALAKRVKSAG